MKKNQNGFSLVEVMLAAAFLGALALVAMQLTKTQTKSSVKAGFDHEILLITNEINGILADPSLCLATFATTISPNNINGKYKTKTAGAPAGGYGNAGVEIDSYLLTGSAPDAILTINFLNKAILKGSGGSPLVPKKINLKIIGSPGAITALERALI